MVVLLGFWESGKVVRTAELHLPVNAGSNIDQGEISNNWIQPSGIFIQPTKKGMQSLQLHDKEQKRMEPTTHIFLTVDPSHNKVKKEEDEVTVKMEIVETGKIESLSGSLKTEVDPSDDGAFLSIKVEEIAVKEEVETNGLKYNGFLNCSDFEAKEELVDLNKPDQDEKPRDVDDKEDDEASSDDEQVDARLLYPRRAPEEISEEDEEDEEDEEVEVKLEEAVVKSIEIMEASCFGQMEDKEWEDGKDKRLNCEKCNRQFSSRRWLAR